MIDGGCRRPRGSRWFSTCPAVPGAAHDRAGAVGVGSGTVLHVPFPRFDAPEVHRFLELLWTRTSPDDWRIAGFQPDSYELTW